MNDLSDPELRIYFFGDFKIETDGEELLAEDWKSRKALNMFKFLIYKQEKKISKEVLLEMFWSDEERKIL